MNDTFHVVQSTLEADEQAHIIDIKEKAQVLLEAFPERSNDEPGEREVSFAKAKLEEAVMWAVKAVTM